MNVLSKVRILGRKEKQPREIIQVDVDFSDWFSNRGDAPASYEVECDDGLTIDGHVLDGTVVRVWLSGGQHLVSYKVTVLLTTNAAIPARKEADFIVRVKEI